MQLHLTLQSPVISLPLAYQSMVHGMIYHALEGHLENVDELHDKNNQQGQRAFKGFTFSQLIGQYSVGNREILFQNQVRIEIRSIDEKLIQSLWYAWHHAECVSLGKNLCQIVSCEITDVHLKQEIATVRMLSPLVAYRTEQNHKTIFYSPDDAAFYRAVCTNAQRKWDQFGNDSDFCFEIMPVEHRPQRRVFTTFKTSYITGWMGYYQMRGKPEVLDMLYQTGIGAKNSEGFGMFTVLNS